MMTIDPGAAEDTRAWGDVETLATLIGGASARVRAARALDELDGLRGLLRADHATLVRWVGAEGAARLSASVHLGRRLLQELPSRWERVETAQQAWQVVAPGLAQATEERLHAVLLDRAHRVITVRELSRGSDCYTVVDPRQILRVALSYGAHSVVLAHNHPSGDPTPSMQDREITRRVGAACQAVGLRLLDHIVVGNGAWSSMATMGILTAWAPVDTLCTG